jgi:hypothetical protein
MLTPSPPTGSRWRSECGAGNCLVAAILTLLQKWLADLVALTMQASATAGRQFSDSVSGRAWGLLYYAPFLVPFRERAKLFQTIVSRVKTAQGSLCVGGGKPFRR